MSWLSVWVCSDLRTLVGPIRGGGRRHGAENVLCFVSSLKIKICPTKRGKQIFSWCPRVSDSDQKQDGFRSPVQLFPFDPNWQILIGRFNSQLKNEIRRIWRVKNCSVRVESFNYWVAELIRINWWNTDIWYKNVLHKHFNVHGSEPKEEIVTVFDVYKILNKWTNMNNISTKWWHFIVIILY